MDNPDSSYAQVRPFVSEKDEWKNHHIVSVKGKPDQFMKIFDVMTSFLIGFFPIVPIVMH